MPMPNIKPLLTALAAKLLATTALTNKLGTFESAPCIFFSSSIPSEAPRPYIHISLPSGFNQRSVKNSSGWSIPLDMTAVSDKEESIVSLIETTDILSSALVGSVLTLSENIHHSTQLTNMTPANTSNDLSGVRLTFSFYVSD